MKSPVRSILRQGSSLAEEVRDGLGALEAPHKKLLDEPVRDSFGDSLDLDKALQRGREQEHRWDYLLGHGPSSEVVALEPHSATTGEIAAVIAKRDAARAQLRAHLRPGGVIWAWFWVASGRTDFVPHDKVLTRLAQAGVTFVGGRLTSKHLPGPAKPGRKK